MSQPRGYGLNGNKLYTNIVKPTETWVTFTVAHTNTNGLGVTSVMSNGYVSAVFMNTNQTVGVSNGLTNPNPQAGWAIIRFANNFNYYLSPFWNQIVPTTSNNTTALTQFHVYVITALGNTTTAQWQTAGLPQGFTPAIGQTFVAAATASISGTGTVGVPGVPTIVQVNAVGTPNTMVSNTNIAANNGAQVVVQFNAATAGGNTVLAATAPADGTIYTLQFCYDASTVTIDGI